MNDIITLRGAILSKYRTIGRFAETLGWKRNKASRIANGLQEPSSNEIIEIAEALGITDRDTFICLFFAPMSTKWTEHTA